MHYPKYFNYWIVLCKHYQDLISVCYERNNCIHLLHIRKIWREGNRQASHYAIRLRHNSSASLKCLCRKLCDANIKLLFYWANLEFAIRTHHPTTREELAKVRFSEASLEMLLLKSVLK